MCLYEDAVLRLLIALDIQDKNERTGSVAVAIERLRTLALQQQGCHHIKPRDTSQLNTLP